jgi:hypothetical protein
MFQIIGAMAEFERSLIQERVKAGLRNARAKGKKFGRPRVRIDGAKVAVLRCEGLSWSQACRNPQCEQGERPAVDRRVCRKAQTTVITRVQ